MTTPAQLCAHGVPAWLACDSCDSRYLGVYGTVMCSFGTPIARYPYQDPDLEGKTMIILGPQPKVGDELLGLRVEVASSNGLTLTPWSDR